ncbi:MAG: flavin reductase family protein [Acidimicrobiia bacterium]|nr:flavin reductase family protein [Acidimicrobiia bacterium]
MSDAAHSHPEIDSGDFRHVLGHFPTGVTVVTSAGEPGSGCPAGVAIGSFASISLDPPLVGFFLGTSSGSWPAIEASGHFCVNVLCDDQQELCGLMASRSEDKFEGLDYETSGTGAPILPGVHAVIDCLIDGVVPAGDHNLIVGRVQSLSTRRDHPPMVFYKGQYGSFAG